DPRRYMSSLSVAEMQMVEIAKAISYESNIIIMDEPTSAITDKEVEKLFSIINLLKNGNTGIVYISHKMSEIFRIADRITILRDGQNVDTKKTDQVSRDELVSMMVGREISNFFPKQETIISDVILRVNNIGREKCFSDVSFELRSGEILGFAGLVGAGRTELMETLFGIYPADSGTITIRGQETRIGSPKDAIAAGFGFVPEDRKAVGLNLKASVKENITLVELAHYCTAGVIRNKQELKEAGRQSASLRIKTPNLDQITVNLSGGNQQKVVIAKWLLSQPEILIMDEPTRGIDVGAKAEIHALISSLAAAGKGIIMISSELPEIIGMSDRVVVMHEGSITGILTHQEIDQERIMHLATGQSRQGQSNQDREE
ncbi:MAG: sugar ABC transporter ATP-binding protein, partial [Spirochaetales bacterium]|nr:sugar ABC transporter ATP-binding protein [Spirochaetales bacterium]MCF7939611.1 sugar ABC transporter ATP-binding protein [Spirochaetales bacterium]